jgi:hypothetical protein
MQSLHPSPVSTLTADAQIRVAYWVGELPFDGADEFEHSIKMAYPSASIGSEPGGLGGGLYTLFLEVVATVSLTSFVRSLLDGVAFDLIKLGTNNLVLRPLLAAQRKLRQRNQKEYKAGELAFIRIIFADSIVTVDADSRVSQNVSESLGDILRLLAQHYEALTLADGQRPGEVYIPVIEDTGVDRRARFRAVLEVDEEMPVSGKVFFEFWGLAFSGGARRVYDVSRSLLIDEYFLYRSEHWDRMSDLWKQRGIL